jgi:TonB-linked SusC/RagA family outer membrane protein
MHDIFCSQKSVINHLILILLLLEFSCLTGISQQTINLNKSQEKATNTFDTLVSKITTGAVSKVTGEILRKSPSVNLSNNLAGRIPGLTVITPGGEPGNDGSRLLIRGLNTIGNNSPLVIVDGIPYRNLERINPNDIETISVLKDASAAIYGMQAANGVILVTTRRGQQGRPIISINLNTGFNQPTQLTEMADAATYATMLNEISYYNYPAAGRYQRYSSSDIQKYTDGSDPWLYPNTDWFKEVIKPLSFQTNNHISVSGTSGKLGYYLSMGALYEDGNYKESATNYSQYDFRINMDANISKNILFTLDLSGQKDNSNYSAIDASTIYRYLLRSKPVMPAFWPNGLPGPDLEYGYNPAVISTNAPGYSEYTSYYLESKAGLAVKIPWINGLSVNGYTSIDLIDIDHNKLTRPWYLYSWDGVSYDGDNNPLLLKMQRGANTINNFQDTQKAHRNSYNANLAYELSLSGKHRFSFITGFESLQGKYRYTQDNGYYNMEHQRMGYYGKIGYSFSDKYQADFAWKYDGSYRFPKGSRFGFFPALLLGWRISNEGFWKENIHFLDELDFHASLGWTGSDSNLTDLPVSQGIPNPGITWEVAAQSNFGLNTRFFNNHVTLDADYFYHIRSDIPLQRYLPLPFENIGKVKNQGFEFTLSYHGNTGDWHYEIGTNGSYSKNKILFMDEPLGIPVYQQSTGHSTESGLYFESLGIFKDAASIIAYPHWYGAMPGDIIFKDVNNDKVIDGLDRVRNNKCGTPMFIAGLFSVVKYKQFDIYMLFQGASGAVVYVNPESGDFGNFYKEYAENRWTPEHPDNTSPRSWNRDNAYWKTQLNTFWLQPTNYIRLKNLEIGYTIRAVNQQKSGGRELRIYLSGFNLLTFSKLNLFDPEMVTGAAYPPQRIINMGLTLTL